MALRYAPPFNSLIVASIAQYSFAVVLPNIRQRL
jgi:hypothetical protein